MVLLFHQVPLRLILGDDDFPVGTEVHLHVPPGISRHGCSLRKKPPVMGPAAASDDKNGVASTNVRKEPKRVTGCAARGSSAACCSGLRHALRTPAHHASHRNANR